MSNAEMFNQHLDVDISKATETPAASSPSTRQRIVAEGQGVAPYSHGRVKAVDTERMFEQMKARAQGERSAGPQARTKKELLSLKGDKLARHLKRGERTGRHSIATDLSLWAADDYHKFQETILMMHKQNQRLRLKDQALENKFRGKVQSTSLEPLALSQLMSAELTDALNKQFPTSTVLDGQELSQQDQDLRREVQES